MTLRIFCDFDGTIAEGDVTDRLLETFADRAWRRIEADWRAGRIGSADCMARQVELLRCSRRALDKRLDGIGIDPDFAGFVAFCRRIGASLTVVSDGLDYAIERMLVRVGIRDVPIVANRLLFLRDGRHAMASPHRWTDCLVAAGTCKCAVVRSPGRPGKSVLIGDGRSDFCAADTVDFVVAKQSLLSFCRDNGLQHVAFTRFAEVPGLLCDWLQARSAFARNDAMAAADRA